MLIIPILILAMIGFYQAARSLNLNGILYGVLSGVFGYGFYMLFAFLTLLLFPKDVEMAYLFGFFGVIAGLILFLVIMQSIGRSRQERMVKEEDERINYKEE